MEDNQRTDCSFRLSLKIITVTEAYAFMHPIIDNAALLIAPHFMLLPIDSEGVWIG